MSPDSTKEPRDQENESKKAKPVSDLPPREAGDESAEQVKGGIAPVDGLRKI